MEIAGHIGIDAEVAEKVMGWHNNINNPREPGMWGIMDYRETGAPVLAPDFPAYSQDIESAWRVVEKLIEDGFILSIDFLHPQLDNNLKHVWQVEIAPGERVTACTAPLAICKAALAVKTYNKT